jgi:hypothetical protein
MPADERFFEIPIYRCSLEEHSKELENEKEAYVKRNNWTNEDSLAIRFTRLFEEREWYPWRYNEIIGWVRIFRLGSQIRGELWGVSQRVSRKLVKKKFFYIGKLFEYSIAFKLKNLTNKRITQIVKDEIKSGLVGSKFERYHVDWENYERITRYFSWKDAMKRKSDQKTVA